MCSIALQRLSFSLKSFGASCILTAGRKGWHVRCRGCIDGEETSARQALCESMAGCVIREIVCKDSLYAVRLSIAQ